MTSTLMILLQFILVIGLSGLVYYLSAKGKYKTACSLSLIVCLLSFFMAWCIYQQVKYLINTPPSQEMSVYDEQ